MSIASAKQLENLKTYENRELLQSILDWAAKKGGIRVRAGDDRLRNTVVYFSVLKGSRYKYAEQFMQDMGGVCKREDSNGCKDVRYKNKITVCFKATTKAPPTRVQEAAHCYEISKIYYNGEIKNVSTPGVTISEVEMLMENDEDWSLSIKASGALIAERLQPNRNYLFERDTANVKLINDVFKVINDNKEELDINIDQVTKYFANINKWNPADMWVFDADDLEEFKKSLNDLKNGGGTYDDLNDIIQTFFERGSAIGISLKKVTKPVLSDINLDRASNKEIRFTLPDQWWGFHKGSGDFYSTQTSYIFFNDKKYPNSNCFLEMRTDGLITAYNAEVIKPGSGARHGKLGLSMIRQIFDRHATMHLDITQSNIPINGAIVEIVKYAKMMGVEVDEELLKKKDITWLTVKYRGVGLIYSLYKQNPDVRLKIIDDIIKMAQSQTEFSSAYLKVEDKIINKAARRFINEFKKLAQKKILRENKSKTLGIVPMAAKPFHAGHMKLIEYASENSDKVVVYVSHKDRIRSGEIPVYGDDMMKIWNNIISKHLPNNVIFVKSGNPITDVFKLIIEASENEDKRSLKYRIFTGEDDVKNYKYIEKFKNVDKEIVPIDRSDTSLTVNISGTKMRKFIEDSDKESFISYLPKQFSEKEKEDYYNILHDRIKKDLKESLSKDVKFYLLNERANLHMDHLEELVILQGNMGLARVINYIQSILSNLKKKGSDIRIKWDGSPAIIFGYLEDRFFVSTKGFFAKTPKICYEPKDCEELFGHSIDLSNKLKEVLKYFRELNLPKGIYQADLLYTKSDLKMKMIKNKPIITFTPNTITYGIKSDSKVGKEILQSKIGCAIHTKYNENEIGEGNPKGTPIHTQFKSTNNVWVAPISVSDSNVDQNELKEIEKNFDELKKANYNINELDDDTILLFNTFVNVLVRNNKLDLLNNSTKTIQSFISWIEDRYNKEADKFKTDRGKQGRYDRRDSTIEKIKNIKLENYIKLYNDIMNLKNDIINLINNSTSDIQTYFKSGGEFIPTSHEGYAISDISGFTKLVNREEFSRQNFEISRNR